MIREAADDSPAAASLNATISRLISDLRWKALVELIVAFDRGGIGNVGTEPLEICPSLMQATVTLFLRTLRREVFEADDVFVISIGTLLLPIEKAEKDDRMAGTFRSVERNNISRAKLFERQ